MTITTIHTAGNGGDVATFRALLSAHAGTTPTEYRRVRRHASERLPG